MEKGERLWVCNSFYLQNGRKRLFYRMRYYLLPIVLICCCCTTLNAQQRVVDSLEKLISNLPGDTVKVNRLNDLTSKLQFLDPAKAAEKVAQSMLLAAKINYPLGLATAYRLRGVLYIDRSALDSGKLFYDKAFAIVKDSKERLFRRQEGLLTHNYGVIYHQRQQYGSATDKYLAAAKIFKEIGEESLYFFPYINLATIYTFLKDNEKALQYAREVNIAAAKMNDPGKVVVAINQEMSIRLELKQYDSVLAPLRKNVERAAEIQNYYGSGKAYNLIGKYFSDGRQLYDSALVNRKKSLAFMEKINNQYEICGLIEEIGYDYMQKGDYINANIHLKKSRELARSLGLDQILIYGLENLVVVEEKLGNINGAYTYLKELVQVNDSLLIRNNRSQMNELEAKYQSGNKELQIGQLEADKKVQRLSIRQKDMLNYTLIAGAVTSLIIAILAYRNYKHRQKLQQQRISELETQQQLTAAEAVLKGEERERTRLAKDLHDGLGGMLSGIKFSLNTMKGNLIMTPENAQAFERSMDMLDSSIQEMRRVAHNMMPEALVKFGLDTALKDFCNEITKSGALQVSYQSIGLEKTVIEQITSITIYRIVQELINNTMKHAAAKTAIVQVTSSDGHLSVTVEDDGKGFDTSVLNQSKGMGWSNIQNRVSFLKGTLDVQSKNDEGTSVHIELNI